MADAKTIDVLLWGATGFTGQMVTAYFAQDPEGIARNFFSCKPGAVPSSLVYAIAGRNRKKLERVKAEAGCKSDVEVFVADAHDSLAVDEIVGKARVCIALAGPMIQYGTAVVSACARFGTHYVDITGEVAWVQDMIEKFGDMAEKTGAVIVPMCGFDSIPSDLGTLFVAKQLGYPAKKAVRRVTGLQLMDGGGPRPLPPRGGARRRTEGGGRISIRSKVHRGLWQVGGPLRHGADQLEGCAPQQFHAQLWRGF